jgi:hypothetical protein
MPTSYDRDIFVRYIRDNFGNQPFRFGDIKDKEIEKIMRRFVVLKHTRPNPISESITISIDATPRSSIKRRKFQLKEA